MDEKHEPCPDPFCADCRCDALEELVGELTEHPYLIGKSWRVNDSCVHCWAIRLVGTKAQRAALEPK